MRKALIAIIFTASALSACGRPDTQAPHSSASASIPSADADLLKNEAQENELCRGGSGDDPKTQQACDRRDKLEAQLRARGWCYGENAIDGAHSEWAKCGSPAPNADGHLDSPSDKAARGGADQSARSVAPEPQPVAEHDSDRIDYDPKVARQKQMFDGLQASLRSCVAGTVDAQLNHGEKSKSRIADQAAFNCGTPLGRSSEAMGLGKKAVVEAQSRVLAYEIIDERVQDSR